MSGLIASSLGSWNVSRQDAHSQNWSHPLLPFREVCLLNKPGVIQSGRKKVPTDSPFLWWLVNMVPCEMFFTPDLISVMEMEIEK